ncbi:hypothetical protein BASA81_007310 [Batrachochytrium salamandrivorans]|nr:hypothetical protein BASA81_007310 [Batrachochytrium salamandrivorans]
MRRNLSTKRVEWSKDFVAKSLAPTSPVDFSKQSFTQYLTSSKEFIQQPNLKLAIADEHSTRTYGDIRRDISVFRQFVTHDLGLHKNDVVTLISPNHVDYFSVVHAFASAGVATSPLNPLYTKHEIESQLRASQSKAVVAHQSCLEHAMDAAKSCGISKVIVLEDDHNPLVQSNGLPSFSKLRLDLNSKPCADDLIISSGKDLCILPFSSGTTGLPKGTVLSHSNLAVNLFQMDDAEGKYFDELDVVISPLPMFHIYGFTVSLNYTLFKGKSLITSSRFDLEKFCQQVEAYKCTTAHLVPPIVLALSKSPIVKQHDLSTLRKILSAAAPLGSELELSVAHAVPSIKVCKQAWGLTELSPIGTMVADEDVHRFPGSVGPVVAMSEAKICDVSDPSKTLPPGSEGELLVRGPQVMQGYLNDPDKTRECLLEDGFLRTGDIAKMNEDGFVFITDRLKELIKVKGWQVAPAELESILVTHPSILDAVVISRPDEESGEVPRAYVVLCPGESMTEKEVVDFAASNVVHYKKLRGGVVFVDKIPKTATGKLLRREVVRMDREKYPVK